MNGLTANIKTSLDSKHSLITQPSRLDPSLIGSGLITSAEFDCISGIDVNIKSALNSIPSAYNAGNLLNAAYVGYGRVASYEFDYLMGLQDYIQPQLNTKQLKLHTSNTITVKNSYTLEVNAESQGRYSFSHSIGGPNNTWYLICTINVGTNFNTGKHIGMELIGANGYNVVPSENWRLIMNFMMSNGSSYKDNTDTVNDVRGQFFSDLAVYLLSSEGTGPLEIVMVPTTYPFSDQIM